MPHIGQNEALDIMMDNTAKPAMDVQIGGNHYKGMAIQPFEMTLANWYDGAVHSILKYVHRHADKGGAEDLDKASHICFIRVEQIEKWGMIPKSRVKIPMQRYITENNIPIPEADCLRLLSGWSTQTWPGTDREIAEQLSKRIQKLKQLRYGESK